MEVKYVASFETTKEVVWLRKFLTNLKVIPNMKKYVTQYCDNNATIGNTKDTRNHKCTKYIDRKYHIIRKVVVDGIMGVVKFASEHNLMDLFTKTLMAMSFEKHLEAMGMRNMTRPLH